MTRWTRLLAFSRAATVRIMVFIARTLLVLLSGRIALLCKFTNPPETTKQVRD